MKTQSGHSQTRQRQHHGRLRALLKEVASTMYCGGSQGKDNWGWTGLKKISNSGTRLALPSSPSKKEAGDSCTGGPVRLGKAEKAEGFYFPAVEFRHGAYGLMASAE